jgi:hypothetical protein
MTISRFVNRTTLLSSDTKPTPQIAQPVILEEIDTGTFYKSDGSSITIQNGPEKSETLTNKVIPPENNEFVEFNTPFDNPFLKNFEQKGHVIPASSVIDSFHGIIDNSILFNSDTVKIRNTSGIGVNFQTLISGDQIGFRSPQAIFRRDKGYELKVEIESNASRVLIGFSTASSFTTNSQVFNASDMGVALGFTPSASFITAYSNDGVSSSQIIASTIPKDLNLHTLEIILGTANIKCIVDEVQTLTLTTDIPGLTDNLYLLIYGIH